MAITALTDVAVGAPITRGALSLVPVYLPGSPAAPVEPSSEGVTISEAPDAVVPTITIINPGALPVLFVEGETVRGGQQDRSLDVSVLVPAATELACPVSCVERGRWGGTRDFDRSRTYAPRRVRRVKTATVGWNLEASGAKRSDQGRVWETVDAELGRLRIDAPTSALRELDAHLERDDLHGVIASLVRPGPLPGQRGIVVAHGHRIVAADGFASEDVLAQHWQALVRGYALDAPSRSDGLTGHPSLDHAVRFLRGFAAATSRTSDGVGLGTEHHVESRYLVGQALVWDDAVVHASAFALAG